MRSSPINKAMATLSPQSVEDEKRVSDSEEELVSDSDEEIVADSENNTDKPQTLVLALPDKYSTNRAVQFWNRHKAQATRMFHNYKYSVAVGIALGPALGALGAAVSTVGTAGNATVGATIDVLQGEKSTLRFGAKTSMTFAQSLRAVNNFRLALNDSPKDPREPIKGDVDYMDASNIARILARSLEHFVTDDTEIIKAALEPNHSARQLMDEIKIDRADSEKIERRLQSATEPAFVKEGLEQKLKSLRDKIQSKQHSIDNAARDMAAKQQNQVLDPLESKAFKRASIECNQGEEEVNLSEHNSVLVKWNGEYRLFRNQRRLGIITYTGDVPDAQPSEDTFVAVYKPSDGVQTSTAKIRREIKEVTRKYKSELMAVPSDTVHPRFVVPGMRCNYSKTSHLISDQYVVIAVDAYVWTGQEPKNGTEVLLSKNSTSFKSHYDDSMFEFPHERNAYDNAMHSDKTPKYDMERDEFAQRSDLLRADPERLWYRHKTRADFGKLELTLAQGAAESIVNMVDITGPALVYKAAATELAKQMKKKITDTLIGSLDVQTPYVKGSTLPFMLRVAHLKQMGINRPFTIASLAGATDASGYEQSKAAFLKSGFVSGLLEELQTKNKAVLKEFMRNDDIDMDLIRLHNSEDALQRHYPKLLPSTWNWRNLQPTGLEQPKIATKDQLHIQKNYFSWDWNLVAEVKRKETGVEWTNMPLDEQVAVGCLLEILGDNGEEDNRMYLVRPLVLDSTTGEITNHTFSPFYVHEAEWEEQLKKPKKDHTFYRRPRVGQKVIFRPPVPKLNQEGTENNSWPTNRVLTVTERVKSEGLLTPRYLCKVVEQDAGSQSTAALFSKPDDAPGVYDNRGLPTLTTWDLERGHYNYNNPRGQLKMGVGKFTFGNYESLEDGLLTVEVNSPNSGQNGPGYIGGYIDKSDTNVNLLKSILPHLDWVPDQENAAKDIFDAMEGNTPQLDPPTQDTFYDKGYVPLASVLEKEGESQVLSNLLEHYNFMYHSWQHDFERRTSHNLSDTNNVPICFLYNGKRNQNIEKWKAFGKIFYPVEHYKPYGDDFTYVKLTLKYTRNTKILKVQNTTNFRWLKKCKPNYVRKANMNTMQWSRMDKTTKNEKAYVENMVMCAKSLLMVLKHHKVYGSPSPEQNCIWVADGSCVLPPSTLAVQSTSRLHRVCADIMRIQVYTNGEIQQVRSKLERLIDEITSPGYSPPTKLPTFVDLLYTFQNDVSLVDDHRYYTSTLTSTTRFPVVPESIRADYLKFAADKNPTLLPDLGLDNLDDLLQPLVKIWEKLSYEQWLAEGHRDDKTTLMSKYTDFVWVCRHAVAQLPYVYTISENGITFTQETATSQENGLLDKLLKGLIKIVQVLANKTLELKKLQTPASFFYVKNQEGPTVSLSSTGLCAKWTDEVERYLHDSMEMYADMAPLENFNYESHRNNFWPKLHKNGNGVNVLHHFNFTLQTPNDIVMDVPTITTTHDPDKMIFWGYITPMIEWNKENRVENLFTLFPEVLITTMKEIRILRNKLCNLFMAKLNVSEIRSIIERGEKPKDVNIKGGVKRHEFLDWFIISSLAFLNASTGATPSKPITPPKPAPPRTETVESFDTVKNLGYNTFEIPASFLQLQELPELTEAQTDEIYFLPDEKKLAVLTQKGDEQEHTFTLLHENTKEFAYFYNAPEDLNVDIKNAKKITSFTPMRNSSSVVKRKVAKKTQLVYNTLVERNKGQIDVVDKNRLSHSALMQRIPDVDLYHSKGLGKEITKGDDAYIPIVNDCILVENEPWKISSVSVLPPLLKVYDEEESEVYYWSDNVEQDKQFYNKHVNTLSQKQKRALSLMLSLTEVSTEAGFMPFLRMGQWNKAVENKLVTPQEVELATNIAVLALIDIRFKLIKEAHFKEFDTPENYKTFVGLAYKTVPVLKMLLECWNSDRDGNKITIEFLMGGTFSNDLLLEMAPLLQYRSKSSPFKTLLTYKLSSDVKDVPVIADVILKTAFSSSRVKPSVLVQKFVTVASGASISGLAAYVAAKTTMVACSATVSASTGGIATPLCVIAASAVGGTVASVGAYGIYQNYNSVDDAQHEFAKLNKAAQRIILEVVNKDLLNFLDDSDKAKGAPDAFEKSENKKKMTTLLLESAALANNLNEETRELINLLQRADSGDTEARQRFEEMYEKRSKRVETAGEIKMYRVADVVKVDVTPRYVFIAEKIKYQPSPQKITTASWKAVDEFDDAVFGENGMFNWKISDAGPTQMYFNRHVVSKDRPAIRLETTKKRVIEIGDVVVKIGDKDKYYVSNIVDQTNIQMVSTDSQTFINADIKEVETLNDPIASLNTDLKLKMAEALVGAPVSVKLKDDSVAAIGVGTVLSHAFIEETYVVRSLKRTVGSIGDASKIQVTGFELVAFQNTLRETLRDAKKARTAELVYNASGLPSLPDYLLCQEEDKLKSAYSHLITSGTLSHSEILAWQAAAGKVWYKDALESVGAWPGVELTSANPPSWLDVAEHVKNFVWQLFKKLYFKFADILGNVTKNLMPYAARLFNALADSLAKFADYAPVYVSLKQNLMYCVDTVKTAFSFIVNSALSAVYTDPDAARSRLLRTIVQIEAASGAYAFVKGSLKLKKFIPGLDVGTEENLDRGSNFLRERAKTLGYALGFELALWYFDVDDEKAQEDPLAYFVFQMTSMLQQLTENSWGANYVEEGKLNPEDKINQDDLTAAKGFEQFLGKEYSDSLTAVAKSVRGLSSNLGWGATLTRELSAIFSTLEGAYSLIVRSAKGASKWVKAGPGQKIGMFISFVWGTLVQLATKFDVAELPLCVQWCNDNNMFLCAAALECIDVLRQRACFNLAIGVWSNFSAVGFGANASAMRSKAVVSVLGVRQLSLQDGYVEASAAFGEVGRYAFGLIRRDQGRYNDYADLFGPLALRALVDAGVRPQAVLAIVATTPDFHPVVQNFWIAYSITMLVKDDLCNYAANLVQQASAATRKLFSDETARNIIEGARFFADALKVVYDVIMDRITMLWDYAMGSINKNYTEWKKKFKAFMAEVWDFSTMSYDVMMNKFAQLREFMKMFTDPAWAFVVRQYKNMSSVASKAATSATKSVSGWYTSNVPPVPTNGAGDFVWNVLSSLKHIMMIITQKLWDGDVTGFLAVHEIVGFKSAITEDYNAKDTWWPSKTVEALAEGFPRMVKTYFRMVLSKTRAKFLVDHPIILNTKDYAVNRLTCSILDRWENSGQRMLNDMLHWQFVLRGVEQLKRAVLRVRDNVGKVVTVAATAASYFFAPVSLTYQLALQLGTGVASATLYELIFDFLTKTLLAPVTHTPMPLALREVPYDAAKYASMKDNFVKGLSPDMRWAMQHPLSAAALPRKVELVVRTSIVAVTKEAIANNSLECTFSFAPGVGAAERDPCQKGSSKLSVCGTLQHLESRLLRGPDIFTITHATYGGKTEEVTQAYNSTQPLRRYVGVARAALLKADCSDHSPKLLAIQKTLRNLFLDAVAASRQGVAIDTLGLCPWLHRYDEMRTQRYVQRVYGVSNLTTTQGKSNGDVVFPAPDDNTLAAFCHNLFRRLLCEEAIALQERHTNRNSALVSQTVNYVEQGAAANAACARIAKMQ